MLYGGQTALGDVLGDSKDINESSKIIVTDRILRQDIIVLVVTERRCRSMLVWGASSIKLLYLGNY